MNTGLMKFMRLRSSKREQKPVLVGLSQSNAEASNEGLTWADFARDLSFNSSFPGQWISPPPCSSGLVFNLEKNKNQIKKPLAIINSTSTKGIIFSKGRYFNTKKNLVYHSEIISWQNQQNLAPRTYYLSVCGKEPSVTRSFLQSFIGHFFLLFVFDWHDWFFLWSF